MSAPITFYNADLCPFAQRTWLALLEKESDPHAPKDFTLKEVNLYNKAPEWLAVNPLGTVPTIKHNDNGLWESLILNEYVNEVLPSSPLLPESASDRWHTRYFIEKQAGALSSAFFKLGMGLDRNNWKQAGADLDAVLKQINDAIVARGGPFVMGSQFTLADIAIFPFIERIHAILPSTREYTVPTSAEYSALTRWYTAVRERASVKITTAERSEQSMNTHPFGARERAEYLREVFRLYDYGMDNAVLLKKQLATAPAGKSSMDPTKLPNYAELKQKYNIA